MALLIDTTVFIILERRGFSPIDIERIVPDQRLAIATITASELLTGVHRADSIERQQARSVFVEAVMRLVRIVPFDLIAARTHARLWADLTAAGTPIGHDDMLVAATAVTHGFTVLTDNVREYHRVTGLTVRQPSWPA